MSKKMLSILKVVLVVIAAFFMFVFLLFWFFINMGTRYSDKIFSPNGDYYVEVSELNGGATTSFNTGVSIIKKNYIFNNLVTIGFNKKSVFGFNGKLESVKPEWVDNNTLKITYSDCSRIYELQNLWQNIKVLYEGQCSVDSINPYINNQDKYGFFYPASYNFKESISGLDGTQIYLDKDQVLDKEGYNLEKGVSILTTYKKDVNLSSYIDQETKYWGSEKKIQDKKIGNIDVVEVTTGYNYPFKFPSHTMVFFRNRNNVLSISFMVGDKTTEEEYENYKRDVELILKSISFY